ncbi:MAG: hypothetical protein WD075_04125 [Rhodospirillales bacterium]
MGLGPDDIESGAVKAGKKEYRKSERLKALDLVSHSVFIATAAHLVKLWVTLRVKLLDKPAPDCYGHGYQSALKGFGNAA